ncbi:response regulator transcription factor [Mucilaginibacter sp. KACC 22063]|uniref:response regulator transcription factor n=1 Tax=Mucilaginibacter sp. KACC 22063 TaxID=3025666 RepID=UPI00236621C4|nr:response regulator transcription factor [Mucilaginibacter sp. KACC 22063]WDF54245.1 response regulator transcription factor [Mucilaginibacter sp. KACC 22063]
MIRILIADDHQVVRRGLRQVLEQEADFEVVGDVSSGLGILQLLENGVEADVLLTDLSMPVMDGFELAQNITSKYPHLEIILLTIQEEESYVQQAFQAGVRSYLFKTAHEEEVVFAIRQVARHQPYLCAGLSDKVIKRMAKSTDLKVAMAADVEFSEREMEVLRLIAAGYTNEEAAEKLFTSRRTVEGHRQSMIDKTGSKNSLALVSFAMRHGLLS